MIGNRLCVVIALLGACGSVVHDTAGNTTIPGDDSTDAGAPAKCARDADCGAGERCDAGTCVMSSCTSDAGCASGQQCQAGTCVTPPPECVQDADCGAGKSCAAGHCLATPPQCTSDAGCGAGQVCQVGSCVTPPPECVHDADCGAGKRCSGGTCVAIPLAIEVVPTTIHDERGDAVTFAQGEPRHVHAGTSVTLGTGTTCPDVFKYGYLLGVAAPVFGTEDARNPIAFRFRSNLSALADFRVRSAAGVLLDWTAAATSGGDFVAELHRDGAQRIPELGTIAGDYFIDLRIRDVTSEVTATACWNHHPMAAPVEVRPLVAATTAGSLATFSLPADSPISQLFGGAPTRVFEGRIVQGTAEAVTLQLDIPVPQGTYTKLAVDDLVAKTSSEVVDCGTFMCDNQNTNCVVQVTGTDPRCSTVAGPVDPADSTVSGPLTAGSWSVVVLEADTLRPAGECAVSGLAVTCHLAGRAIGAAARELVVDMAVRDLDDLRPADGAIAETMFDGVVYTGLPAAAIATRCNKIQMSSGINPGGSHPRLCTEVNTFFEVVALDSARVDFAPITTIASIGFSAGASIVAPYAPSGITGAALTWNAGNDDLPGPSH